jgi:hypothetical protein
MMSDTIRYLSVRSQEKMPIDILDKERQAAALNAEVESAYQSAFADKTAFDAFYLQEKPSDARKLLILLGVSILRLLRDPAERFLLLGNAHRKDFPSSSIHQLAIVENYHHYLFDAPLCLTPHAQSENEALRALSQQQPDLVARSIVIDSDESDTPRISLDDVKMLLSAILPPEASLKKSFEILDRIGVDITSPSITLAIGISQNGLAGAIMEINVRSVAVTEDMRPAFQEFFDNYLSLLGARAAIHGLQPSEIRTTLREGGSELIPRTLYLTPGLYSDHGETLHENWQYFPNKYSIVLDPKVALFFDFISQKPKVPQTPVPAFFSSIQLLRDALFGNTDAGEVSSNSTDSHLPQTKSDAVSPTHQKIIDTFIQGKRSIQEFLLASKAVIDGYRPYSDSSDAALFTLPEGFTGIAVAQEGDFAIGYQEAPGGLVLCFQIANKEILRRIEAKKTSLQRSIDNLLNQMTHLDAQAANYLPKTN